MTVTNDVSVRSHQPVVSVTDALRLDHPKRVLLVDYRDSFVHNLGSYLRELGADVTTVRHGFPEELLDELAPQLVFLSPGPFAPRDFGMPDFIQRLVARKLPIFGVCLGHQGIGESFGGHLGQLALPMHGKVSAVEHAGESILTGLESGFDAGRYHSLYVIEESLPDCLEVLARSKDSFPGAPPGGVIMALRHKTLPIAGVQFHPESLMTLKESAGHRLLSNVLNMIALTN
jgi:anthranilate synthase